MSIHQLTPQNFSVSNRGQKRYLNINLPGPVLVFFKTERCDGCKAFKSVFYQIAREEKRINYAIADVTSREIVEMSRQTTTSITAVPFLLLFINGGPHAKYNGKKNIASVKSFINKALQHVPPQSMMTQDFMPSNSSMHRGNGGNYPPPPGIYDNQQPPNAPRQGHAGYNKQNMPGSQRPNNMPEISNDLNIHGGVKGGGGPSAQQYLNDVEDDDDDKFLMPSQVTPYNAPWEVPYKKLGVD